MSVYLETCISVNVKILIAITKSISAFLQSHKFQRYLCLVLYNDKVNQNVKENFSL